MTELKQGVDRPNLTHISGLRVQRFGGVWLVNLVFD